MNVSISTGAQNENVFRNEVVIVIRTVRYGFNYGIFETSKSNYTLIFTFRNRVTVSAEWENGNNEPCCLKDTLILVQPLTSLL